MLKERKATEVAHEEILLGQTWSKADYLACSMKEIVLHHLLTLKFQLP